MVDVAMSADGFSAIESDVTMEVDPQPVAERVKNDVKLRNFLRQGFGWELVEVVLLKCDAINREFYSIAVSGPNCNARFLDDVRQEKSRSQVGGKIVNFEGRRLEELHRRVSKLVDECLSGADGNLLPVGVCTRKGPKENNAPYQCFGFFMLDDDDRPENLNLAERIRRHPLYGGLDVFVARFGFDAKRRLKLVCGRVLRAIDTEPLRQIKDNPDLERQIVHARRRAIVSAAVGGILFIVAFLLAIFWPVSPNLAVYTIVTPTLVMPVACFAIFLVAAVAAEIARTSAIWVLKFKK